MIIGKDMRSRMDLFGISVSDLARVTFLEEDYIESILADCVKVDEIDTFDFALICDALHCRPEYFTDENVKRKDMVLASMNRGSDTVGSRVIKAKIQDFMADFSFINKTLQEG